MQNNQKIVSGLIGFFSLTLMSCASSPMSQRLENNFVYSCALQLLEKKISPGDAEKLCTAAHQAELQENKQVHDLKTPSPIPPDTQRLPAATPSSQTTTEPTTQSAAPSTEATPPSTESKPQEKLQEKREPN